MQPYVIMPRAAKALLSLDLESKIKGNDDPRLSRNGHLLASDVNDWIREKPFAPYIAACDSEAFIKWLLSQHKTTDCLFPNERENGAFYSHYMQEDVLVVSGLRASAILSTDDLNAWRDLGFHSKLDMLATVSAYIMNRPRVIQYEKTWEHQRPTDDSVDASLLFAHVQPTIIRSQYERNTHKDFWLSQHNVTPAESCLDGQQFSFKKIDGKNRGSIGGKGHSIEPEWLVLLLNYAYHVGITLDEIRTHREILLVDAPPVGDDNRTPGTFMRWGKMPTATAKYESAERTSESFFNGYIGQRSQLIIAKSSQRMSGRVDVEMMFERDEFQHLLNNLFAACKENYFGTSTATLHAVIDERLAPDFDAKYRQN